MRKFSLWLACSTLIFTTPVAAQQTLNVRDADIRAFVQDAARVTGQTFIVDGRVTGKVSVVTDRPLSRSEYFEVFLSTLRANGLVAIPMRGGGYRIQPSDGAATQPTRVGSRAESASQFVTEVFRLRSIDAATAVETLRPLISREGSLTANRSANSLVVADYADNIRRIRDLIRQIDRDSAATQIVTLDNAGAREIATALQGLAGQGGGEGARTSVSIAAIDSSNAIALRGDPTSVARFAEMAKQLDARAQSGSEIRVYRLEHANAETLLETVQSLIGGQSGGARGSDMPSVAAPANGGAPAASSAPIVATSTGGGTNSIGGRGPIVVTRYEGTNALIVAANPDVQRSLGELIRQLDTRPEQVLVEAIVVEIGNEAAKKLGVQFLVGGKDAPFAATNYTNATPNILTIAGAVGAEELTRTTTTINGNTTTTATNSALGDGLQQAAAASILNATGGFGGFALDIGKNAIFGTIINAIAADTESNLLATPHIVTLNNQKAKFLVGQEVPVSTGEQLSANFENAFRTVQRQEVGIKLEVTPQVNAQGDVKLFLKQEVSSVAGPVSSRSNDLVLNKREFETTLTVGDGQLLAIGGLLNDDERRTIERIPLLSDIPLIGELFKSRSRSRSKTNLMVFIRPTILRSRQDGDRLTGRRYDYVRDMQRLRNPDMEPSIDELLRDYMGATPPTDPNARASDIMIGADGNLMRPAADGPLKPSDVPASAISANIGDGQ
ncbi:type II secretion system secretin GspD [Sphingorhabdus sp. EL138]|uniref:type II secretion system secretin GspD n=1 Tax=Sphingorhabdus sp. EL138 TaxID=2073156 RepID=UPI0025DE6DD4|nr:type II secretion system secretin GspD [Sphingorhabdus sp. EL138]